MAKSGDKGLPEVLNNLYLLVKITAICLYPVMPRTSAKIWEILKCSQKLETAGRRLFKDNEVETSGELKGFGRIEPLFPRK